VNPRQPPGETAPCGAPASCGVTHREAPSASRRCRGTPRELRISSRSDGHGPDRPRDAGPRDSAETRRRRARSVRGGSRRRRSLRRNVMKCSEGGRPRAPVRTSADVRTRVSDASSDPASRCVPPPVPQSWGSGDPRGKRSRSRVLRKRGTAARRPKESRANARKPHGRQRPSWPRGGAGSNPSRRRETSRTDRAGGGNPGDDGPARSCRRRGEEPQEGKAQVVRPGPGTAEVRPERGPSLRELSRTPVRDMPCDGRPRGRTPRRGGGGEPIAPLRRTETAPRGRATL